MWDIPFLDKTVSVLRIQEITPVWDNLDRILRCHDEIAYDTYGADVLMQVRQWSMHPVVAAGFEVLDTDSDPIHAYIRSLRVPAPLTGLLQDIQRQHGNRFLKQPELEELFMALDEELASDTTKSVVKSLYEQAFEIRSKLIRAWHSKLSHTPANLVFPVANENLRHWQTA